VQKESVTKLV